MRIHCVFVFAFVFLPFLLLFCFITSLRLHVPINQFKNFFSDTQSFDTIPSNFFRENFSILILKPNFSTPISRTSKSWQQFKNWVVPLCDRCSKPHAQTGKAQTDESFFIVGLPYADEGELSYNITSSVCLLDIWDTISCTKSISRLPTKGLIKALSKSWPYLIFVIFFTLAKFLENKIYTEKRQFFALNL